MNESKDQGNSMNNGLERSIHTFIERLSFDTVLKKRE